MERKVSNRFFSMWVTHDKPYGTCDREFLMLEADMVDDHQEIIISS